MSTATISVSADEARVAELVDRLLSEFPPAATDPATFLGAQFDLGLAWVHFDEGNGGLGLNPKLQRLINERLSAAGAPNPVARNPIGHGMCGPTVAVWDRLSKRSDTFARCSRAKRCGASSSRSPVRVPTSPVCRPRGFGTATSGS